MSIGICQPSLNSSSYMCLRALLNLIYAFALRVKWVQRLISCGCGYSSITLSYFNTLSEGHHPWLSDWSTLSYWIPFVSHMWHLFTGGNRIGPFSTAGSGVWCRLRAGNNRSCLFNERLSKKAKQTRDVWNSSILRSCANPYKTTNIKIYFVSLPNLCFIPPRISDRHFKSTLMSTQNVADPCNPTLLPAV